MQQDEESLSPKVSAQTTPPPQPMPFTTALMVVEEQSLSSCEMERGREGQLLKASVAKAVRWYLLKGQESYHMHSIGSQAPLFITRCLNLLITLFTLISITIRH